VWTWAGERRRAGWQWASTPVVWSPSRLVARWPKPELDALVVVALFVLAWLRITAPTLLQLFDSGRPAFNAVDAPAPVVVRVVGAGFSAAFYGLAAAAVVRGVLLLRSGDGPVRSRPGDSIGLILVVSPLVVIAGSGFVNHQPPGAVWLALPIFALAVWLRPPSCRILAAIGRLVVATAAISLLLTLVRPDLGLLTGSAAGAKHGFLNGLLAGPYLHPNILGITLALGLPFVLAIEPAAQRWSGLLLVLTAVVWTGSRTSQLASVVVLAAYGCVRRFPTRVWYLSVLVAIGSGLVVVVPLVTREPEAFTRRGRIWTALLDRYTERPLLGFGPEFFQRQPQLAKALGGRFTHGHNLMVEMLIVGGAIGFALFALMLAVLWRRAVAFARAGRPESALFVVALLHVSWLEASQASTTLAGYAMWLPLITIMLMRQRRPGTPDGFVGDALDATPNCPGCRRIAWYPARWRR